MILRMEGKIGIFVNPVFIKIKKHGRNDCSYGTSVNLVELMREEGINLDLLSGDKDSSQ